MENSPRRRAIPRSVVDRLVSDMRARCCVCRVVLDPQRADPETDFSSLEKHHLIYLSDGGNDDYDNLLLVCANCHTKIHRQPDSYPVAKLKEMKDRWKNMTTVLGNSFTTTASDAAVDVHFIVLSLNRVLWEMCGRVRHDRFAQERTNKEGECFV